jgi:hypothetical protein
MPSTASSGSPKRSPRHVQREPLGMEARIEPLAGSLPSLLWRWDPETDILSGSFKGTRSGSGLTGTVELSDEQGSIAVLDVNNGVICGLDVVVWPEVATVPELTVPSKLTDGRVVLPARPSRPGVASVEVDTTLTVSTNSTESVFHLRIGPRREVDVVRVADHLLIEVDRKGDLAGFWLTDVPAFPAEAEM